MLLEAPVQCIEYVVAHEFTHFLEANHSRNFYKKLEAVMPDWKARKNKLNGR
jgi:predicted metal-dependent hydrolase